MVQLNRTNFTKRARVSVEMSGMRLDKVLVELFPDYSRSRLQAWLKEDRIFVNGAIPDKANQKVKADELIELSPGDFEHMREVEPEYMSLNVVAESDQYWVIDKPAGLVVHPAPGNWGGTLMNGLLALDPQLRQVPRAGIVHRLDKDTTGLMAVARTAEVQLQLIQMLQARIVKRVYLAMVWGRVSHSLTVNQPIGRDPRNRLKMAVVAFGKPAITHFTPLCHGDLEGIPVSLMVCRLETGRTHQIRVHAQHAGFALVGDPVYKAKGAGSHSILKKQSIELPSGECFHRQCLHAAALSFPDPSRFKAFEPGQSFEKWQKTLASLDWQKFNVNLPQDFSQLAQLAGLEFNVNDALASISQQTDFMSSQESLFQSDHTQARQDDDDWFDNDDTEIIYVRDDD